MKTVITFGRMNPPTKGHEKLINAVKDLAGDGDHHVFTSMTHEPKKNPLSPEQKHGYLKSSFPNTNIVSQRSPFHALTHLQDEGYKDVTVVVGADRVSEFERIGSHKDFNFDNYNVVSAGERSGGDIENISASGARAAAKEKRYGDFKGMTPSELSGKDIRSMYSDIRTQMEEFNLTEELFSDKEELELYFEAFFPMKTLFEQQGDVDFDQGNEDRDRKRLDREQSRKKSETNPWPELLIVRTAGDNKLRIIPKADFESTSQEIVSGNYPGAPPMGEVTPQIAFGVMQEPDFEASKTSNRLLKMFGVSDPRDLDIGQAAAGGGGGAPAPASAGGGAPAEQEMGMEMGMAPAPRTPPDGIEITDPASLYPDWDHSPDQLISSGVMMWNMLTGRNALDGGVPMDVAEWANFSATLSPSAERFGTALTQQIPAEYFAIDNSRSPGMLTQSWVENGGTNAIPTADLIFMNPATNDTIRANVKVGKTNLLPPSENESNVLFNTLATNGMITPFAKRKEVKKFSDGIKNKLTQVLSQIEQKAGTIRESKDDVFTEATQLYDEVAGKIEDLMSLDKSLKKSILREILTGELQFGPESLSSATHIIATNKDGTATQLQQITNFYISRLNEVANVNIIFAPANIEERVETEATPGDTFIDYVRLLTQNMEDKLDLDDLAWKKPNYEPGTDFGLDAVSGTDHELNAVPDPFDGVSDEGSSVDFGGIETKQNLRTMVQTAAQNLDSILDIMRFFNIGVESIDIDPINLTTLNEQRADKYNIVTVNGKRFRVPVDKNTEDLMDDYDYIENIFTDIIMEGRKVRKYKKGEGKCGTGSDPEWCYQKKKKKYRAKLQKYNRDNGTHGNGDDKDASHKNGKISGFEDEKTNRSRNGKGSKKRKKLKEEHGAGDEGTSELLMKYLKDTPYSGLINYKPQIPSRRKKKDDSCKCKKI